MNDFHRVMSQRSNLELYRILYHEVDKYQEEAIAAARIEFAKRNISQDIFETFEQQIREKSQSEVILSVQQQDEIKNKAIQFFDFLKPKEDDTYEKRLVLISIFLTVIYTLNLIADFEFIWALLSGFPDWDLSILEVLLTYSIIPIGIYGLWKFKKYGWSITIAFLCFFAVANIFLILENLKYSLKTKSALDIRFDALFERPSVGSLLIQVLIMTGILYYLNKTPVLEIYNIKSNVRWTVISAVLLISMLLWGSLFVMF